MVESGAVELDQAAGSDRVVAVAAGVAFAVASVVVAIGAIAAARGGYVALADDALVAHYTREVYSARSPLVGMPASTERFAGVTAHHPGPLLFWIYAPFVAALGAAKGLLVGAAVVNLVGAAGCVFAGARRAGATGAALGGAAAVGALLVFGGPAGTFRPVNSIAVNTVLVAFVLLSWGVAEADRVVVAPWLVAASLLVQAELIFLPSVAVVGGISAAIGARTWWRRWPRDRRPGVEPVSPWNRAVGSVAAVAAVAVAARWVGPVGGLVVLGAVAVSALLVLRWSPARAAAASSWPGRWTALGLALWVAPIADAIGRRGGNLAALWAYLGSDVSTLGWRGGSAGVRVVLEPPTGVLTESHFWAGWGVLPVAIAVALAVVSRFRGSHQDVRSRRGLVTGGVLIAAGFGASMAPGGEGFVFHHLSWLMLLSVVLWAALSMSLLELSAPRLSGRASLAIAMAVLMVASGAALRRPSTWGLQPHERWAHQVIAGLGRDAEGIEGGVAGVVAAGGSIEAILVSSLAEVLRPHGVEALFGPSAAVDDHRALHERLDEVSSMIYLVPGDAVAPAGMTVLSESEPADWPRQRVSVLAAEVAAVALGAERISLTPGAEAGLDRLTFGRLPGGCLRELDPTGTCQQRDSLPPTAELPEMLVLDLYREGLVSAPALPDALMADVASLGPGRPLQLWQGPVPASLVPG